MKARTWMTANHEGMNFDMNLARPRNVARVALTALVAMLSLIGLSLPASAAGASAGGAGTGVLATANWDWVGTSSISIYNRWVEDTACDNNDVYLNIRIYQELNPDGTDVAGMRNNLGCGRAFHSTEVRPWHGSNNITGVRVRACVDDALGDTCYRSAYQDNPNT